MKVEFLNDINSKALESLCVKKLMKLEKFYKGGEPTISVGFYIDGREHLVTLSSRYNGFDLKAKGKSEDMYKSLDVAIDNLKDQITKNKYDNKTKRKEREYNF
ncbi:MAG: HPF/RaiA family ribosome-associated protein [Christensenellales bacterium]